MHFRDTGVPGACLIELDLRVDRRGHFARTWCRDEFARQGLNTRIAQCSVSFNSRRGTLRGLHWQAAPHVEAKLVRCTRGAIFDVVVDVRPDSTAFGRWFGVELTPENHRQLYIPEGCAHGFQTLRDDSEVSYVISEDYHPECARGARWNDPLFAITWPLDVTVISDQDLSYPDFAP